MGAIVPFLRDSGAFAPKDIQAMSRALAEVCVALNIGRDAAAKEVIAVRIIELARRGERDAVKLRERLLSEAGGGTDLYLLRGVGQS